MWSPHVGPTSADVALVGPTSVIFEQILEMIWGNSITVKTVKVPFEYLWTNFKNDLGQFYNSQNGQSALWIFMNKF